MFTALRFLLFFICLSFFSLQAKPLFKQIAQENLKSLLISDEDEEEPDYDSMPWPVAMREMLKRQFELRPFVKRNKAFTLFKKYEQKYPVDYDVSLDKASWIDLELLCGSKSSPANHLAAAVDRTVIEVGRITLFSKLITPTSNIDALQAQQKIVKELVINEQLFKQLHDQCLILQKSENAFLSLWMQDAFSNMAKRKLTIKFPFSKKIESWLNLQPWAVELRDKLQLGARLLSFPLLLKYTYTMGNALKHQYYDKNVTPAERAVLQRNLPLISDPWIWFRPELVLYVVTRMAGDTFENPMMSALADTGETVRSVGSYAGEKEFYEAALVMRECLQAKLISIAAFLNGAQSLIKTAQKNEVLLQHMPMLQTIDKTFSEKSDEVKKLLKLLKSKTFQGEPSALNQYTGRVFVTYRMLTALKDELADLLVAVGQIDAQLSIARLYKEFETKSVRFCFPTFVHSAQGPAVDAQQFWNPVLSAEKAIANNVTLGALFNQRPNMVVTGPNAGGKSTIMKGFVINVICAQSLGISPAASLTLTPFKRIMAYLNITDDLAAGNSHFKAGVTRARELIEASETLQLHEYGLFAADELFNGTTYHEGQAAAFSLLKKLGSVNNVMISSPTHFPLVTTLEAQTDCFSNYKVSVTYDEQNKIVYPYKLEPGIAHQNVAFKILEEEGFGDEFLAEATRCLQH